MKELLVGTVVVLISLAMLIAALLSVPYVVMTKSKIPLVTAKSVVSEFAIKPVTRPFCSAVASLLVCPSLCLSFRLFHTRL